MPEQAVGKTGMERWLVWLFAGIGVLAALAVIGLAVIAAMFSWHMNDARDAPAQVAAKATAQPYTVQQVDGIEGTNLIAVTIGMGEGGGGGSYSRGPESDKRNLVLLDKLTGASRRLLPGNDRRIADISFLPAVPDIEAAPDRSQDTTVTETVDAATPVTKARPSPMAYYVLVVRQKDGPLLDVLAGNLAGGAQTWVLKGIDGVDRMWMIAPTRLGVLFRQGLKLQYRVIDIPTLKIVTATPVDIG